MLEQITFAYLRENLSLFRKLYDAARLVDPVSKSVLEYSGSDLRKTEETCYYYWQNKKICDNCISIRAGMEKKALLSLNISRMLS